MVNKSSSIRIGVKVVPGASCNEVVGPYGEGLKIRVAAPPEKGKANAAVIQLLAAHFGVDSLRVRIVSGIISALSVRYRHKKQ